LAKPLTPSSSIARLQLAQRIRQVLVREIDYAIEVDRLLTDACYARDVLLVCDALAGGEAPPLAAQFRLMPMPAAAAAGAGARGPGGPGGPGGAPGHAQQATDWARDSSGFGLSQPPPVAPVAGARPRAAEPPASPPAGPPDGRAANPAAGRPTSAADQRRNWLPRWRDSR
jgi:hypothetical protein